MSFVDLETWELDDEHPWVGKACGVERIEGEARVPGQIERVWRFDGGTKQIEVDLDEYEQPFVVAPERVEVLT